EGRVDKVLVVKIAPAEQLKRLQQRDGLDTGAAQQRMAAQMTQQQKIDRADFVIDNSGSLTDLKNQVDSLWSQLVSAPQL
ncbi:MAG: dephospho-CoA kinase, partial [Desulfuromonadales bacterium]|nr:dephospho-CoA kinase [Desulfuromonadales bacterium]